MWPKQASIQWYTSHSSHLLAFLLSHIVLVNSRADRKLTAHETLRQGMSCYGFKSSQTPLNSSLSPFPPGCQIDTTNDTDASPPRCISTYEDFGCGRGVVVVNLDPKSCNGHSRGMLMCCTPCDGLVMHSYNCKEPYCEWGRKDADQLYFTRDNGLSCSYRAGKWSTCHPDELRQQRVDSLVEGDTSCPKNQTLQLVCNAEEIFQTPTKPATTPKPKRRTTTVRSIWPTPSNCRYTEGAWSECLNTTETRQRTKVLLRGDPTCPDTKEEIKSCFTRSGKERCFYGHWSRWSSCENGMRTRVRQVLSKNANECFKTVKAKMCPSLSGTRDQLVNELTSSNRRKLRRSRKKQRL